MSTSPLEISKEKLPLMNSHEPSTTLTTTMTTTTTTTTTLHLSSKTPANNSFPNSFNSQLHGPPKKPRRNSNPSNLTSSLQLNSRSQSSHLNENGSLPGPTNGIRKPYKNPPNQIVSKLVSSIQDLWTHPPYLSDSKYDSKTFEQENEMIDIADAFISTIQQLDSKFEIPTLTFGEPSLKQPEDSHIVKEALTEKLKERPRELVRRISAQFDREITDDDVLLQAMFDLSQICKTGVPSATSSSPSKETSPLTLGTFETSGRFLFSLSNIHTSQSPSQLLQRSMSRVGSIREQKSGDETQLEATKSDIDNDESDEEWLTPRIQVYFQIYTKNPKGVEQQNNHCYNCGARIESGFLGGARYCDYTGKFYCRSCHLNETFLIPARILHNWDFRNYKISHRAKYFLEEMWKEPIFDVAVINISLYEKIKPLAEMKLLRTQLSYVRDFLYTCRRSDKLVQKTFGTRAHLVNSVDMYSLEDFVGVHDSSLLSFVKAGTSELIGHILDCEICQSKGFICEFCKSKEILYPFQLKIVAQCGACKSFFHKRCYVPADCPKCMRIEGYRLRDVSHCQT